ncbi:hypothetical protein HK104_009968 [Borealophlyctis nickersoniae]|nr:hypothetical protein HK104_009968 [Borealophlyctis nickersoniae]
MADQSPRTPRASSTLDAAQRRAAAKATRDRTPWPVGWYPLDETRPSYSNSAIPLEEPGDRSSDQRQVYMVLDQSVLTALLDQTYSDTRFEVVGYLGGRWIEFSGDNANAGSADGEDEGAASSAASVVTVCHVSHFVASTRSVEELMKDNVEETEDSLATALALFKEWGYAVRSNDPMRALQPTRKDLSKQVFLQRALGPASVGLLLSVASANNPNRFFPTNPRAPPSAPLHGPSHAVVAFRAVLEEGEKAVELDSTFASTPNWAPDAFFYHTNLKAVRILVGVHDQPYMAPVLMRETIRTLKSSLEESRAIYLAQAADCTDRPARRMFLDADHDAFLMGFWKNSVVTATNAVDQDFRTLSGKRFWLYEEINKRIAELKGWWDESNAAKRRGVKRKKSGEEAPQGNEKGSTGEETKAPALRPFDRVLDQIINNPTRAGTNVTSRIPSTSTLREIVQTLSAAPPRFNVSRVRPVVGRHPDPLLFEADLSRTDRPKRKPTARPRKKIKESEVEKAAGRSSTKDKGKGKIVEGDEGGSGSSGDEGAALEDGELGEDSKAVKADLKKMEKKDRKRKGDDLVGSETGDSTRKRKGKELEGGSAKRSRQATAGQDASAMLANLGRGPFLPSIPGDEDLGKKGFAAMQNAEAALGLRSPASRARDFPFPGIFATDASEWAKNESAADPSRRRPGKQLDAGDLDQAGMRSLAGLLTRAAAPTADASRKMSQGSLISSVNQHGALALRMNETAIMSLLQAQQHYGFPLVGQPVGTGGVPHQQPHQQQHHSQHSPTSGSPGSLTSLLPHNNPSHPLGMPAASAMSGVHQALPQHVLLQQRRGSVTNLGGPLTSAQTGPRSQHDTFIPPAPPSSTNNQQQRDPASAMMMEQLLQRQSQPSPQSMQPPGSMGGSGGMKSPGSRSGGSTPQHIPSEPPQDHRRSDMYYPPRDSGHNFGFSVPSPPVGSSQAEQHRSAGGYAPSSGMFMPPARVGGGQQTQGTAGSMLAHQQQQYHHIQQLQKLREGLRDSMAHQHQLDDSSRDVQHHSAPSSNPGDMQDRTESPIFSSPNLPRSQPSMGGGDRTPRSTSQSPAPHHHHRMAQHGDPLAPFRHDSSSRNPSPISSDAGSSHDPSQRPSLPSLSESLLSPSSFPIHAPRSTRAPQSHSNSSSAGSSPSRFATGGDTGGRRGGGEAGGKGEGAEDS